MSNSRDDAAAVSFDDVAKLLWDVGEPSFDRDEAHTIIDEMSRLLWAISERNPEEGEAVHSTFSRANFSKRRMD